jgi:hypothetical protein
MKITEVYKLEESSGYSLEGSYTPDLVFSKLWLIRELGKITNHVDVMYVLGAWYSNLAMLLTVAPEVDVDKIINVETDKEFLQVGKKMLAQRGVDNVEFMLKDANDLNYQQLTDRSAVVNTSLIDIPGTDWFTNIPAGTMVVMQARDHVEDNQFRNPEDIQQTFPLDQVLYSGSLELEDPETEYSRFMVIGIK